jgi:ABC-type proline/glycine betaine transport system permease subunit
VLGQLLVCPKSPLTVMLAMVIGALPVLLRFTSLGALVVPTD